MSGLLIALAAGGTGGHVFPAEALAGELMARGHRLVLFTDRRGKEFGGALGSLATLPIRSGGIAGRGIGQRIAAIFDLVIGFFQARAKLKELRPAAVVGFGGYASVPPMLAAIQLGLPSVIHEQNAVLGRANRLLASRARMIATSFAETSETPSEAARVSHIGMPVRPNVVSLRALPYPAIGEAGINLLVTGGSQGARILSEVLPKAIAALPHELRQRLSIVQQCRPEDIEAVREEYSKLAVKAELSHFFADLPERLAASHLVICRAGASTMAELTVVGRPAILVPYMHAIDDHQTANAHALEAAGGGWLIPQESFTAESLSARLASLLASPGTLERAALCAKTAGRPDAVARLADLVLASAMETRP
jgi:UDP-N-acetylglucosamine--N-acetylmuramyl-(pentapeptide) pyrophosphoryl-undecaprenol N-acetylglucosamine transferase